MCKKHLTHCPSPSPTLYPREIGLQFKYSSLGLVTLSTSTGCVKYVGYKSDRFPISSGTRQGCPTCSVDLLQSDIQGVEVAGYHHKLCLFADDILLFLTSPLITTPNLFCILERFTSILGLEVNQQKSLFLNLSFPNYNPLSLINGPYIPSRI